MTERSRSRRARAVINRAIPSPTGQTAAIAQRIERYAQVVGRENVIAGTDCGFGTFVGSATVDPDIAWAKFRSMAEGAQLATEHLWAR